MIAFGDAGATAARPDQLPHLAIRIADEQQAAAGRRRAVEGVDMAAGGVPKRLAGLPSSLHAQPQFK